MSSISISCHIATCFNLIVHHKRKHCIISICKNVYDTINTNIFEYDTCLTCHHVKIIYLILCDSLGIRYIVHVCLYFSQIHVVSNLDFKYHASTAVSQNNKMHKCDPRTTKYLSILHFRFFIFFINDIISF